VRTPWRYIHKHKNATKGPGLVCRASPARPAKPKDTSAEAAAAPAPGRDSRRLSPAPWPARCSRRRRMASEASSSSTAGRPVGLPPRIIVITGRGQPPTASPSEIREASEGACVEPQLCERHTLELETLRLRLAQA